MNRDNKERGCHACTGVTYDVYTIKNGYTLTIVNKAHYFNNSSHSYIHVNSMKLQIIIRYDI